MKQFALSVASAFLGGLLLVVVVLVATNVGKSRRSGQEGQRQSRADPQRAVRVIEHARVDGTQHFTVRGAVQNVASEAWQVVEFRVTLRVAGAKVNECESMLLDEIAPGARQAFQIVCRDADGAGLPPGTTYDLAVTSVW